MADANLVENDQIVEGLSLAIAKGEGGLSSVPNLIKRVIREEMWRRRVVRQTGEVVEFERFTDFVIEKAPEGLNADVRMLERMCADDLEAMTLLDAALKAEAVQGKRNDIVYNIHNVEAQQEPRPSGTDKRAALRRLRKDRPDLHEQVIEGKLSPHGAMIEAGFRPVRKAINVDDPESAAATIRKYMSDEDIRELIRLLVEGA